jgi:hypothetical protein
MMPEMSKKERELITGKKQEHRMRKQVGFARVWNALLLSFYEIHKLNKDELNKYSFKIK